MDLILVWGGGGGGAWLFVLFCGVVLTCAIVEGIKQGKEGANGKDVVVLVKSHLGETSGVISGAVLDDATELDFFLYLRQTSTGAAGLLCHLTDHFEREKPAGLSVVAARLTMLFCHFLSSWPPPASWARRECELNKPQTR